jgi:hypothetical protein
LGFTEIKATLRPLYPVDIGRRYCDMDALERVLRGTFYEQMKHPFDRENNGNRYIPLRERRPAVQYNLARIITDQTNGLLWGDEQTPFLRSYWGDEPTDTDRDNEQKIERVVEHYMLPSVVASAYEEGVVGSCAVIVRGTPSGAYFDLRAGKLGAPTFDPRDPAKMLTYVEEYPIAGADLVAAGYDIPVDKRGKRWWLKLLIDAKKEDRFEPMLEDDHAKMTRAAAEGKPATDDKGRPIVWKIRETFAHKFGVVPVIWGRNLDALGNVIDGPCLFGSILDIQIEIDYLLSQVGRGYRYTADPMLAIERGEMAGTVLGPVGQGGAEQDATQRDVAGAIIKSPTNVLDLPAGSKAQMLEITGNGLKAATDHIKLLREWALEVVGGMKSDAESTRGAESGRALEMLWQALYLVAKRQRVAWGDRFYLPLVRMVLLGISVGEITLPSDIEAPPPDLSLHLVWPSWTTPSGADLLSFANAAEVLAGGSAKTPVALLPRDAVTKIVATNLGQRDAAALIAQLDDQKNQDQADAQAQADTDAQRQITVAKATKPPKGNAA